MNINYKYKSLIEAISSDDIDEFKRMYEAGFKCNDVCCLTSKAAMDGNLEFLKYLLSIGFRMDKVALSKAAVRGHLHILKFAVEHGCVITIDVVQLALDHVQCLKYLYEQKPDMFADVVTGSPYHIEHLVMAGNLESFKYLHSLFPNWTWSDKLPARASVGGHIDCLKYLFENGCPHDYRVIYDACVTGELECIKYAVEHGCDYDDRAIRQAIENHNFACARYLLDCLITSKGRDVCWGFKSKMFDSFNLSLPMYLPGRRHDWPVMYLCQKVEAGELNLDQYPKIKAYVTGYLSWKQETTVAMVQTVGLFVCDVRVIDTHVLCFIFPQPL